MLVYLALAVIAGVVVLVALAFAALSYIRAVNALGDFIRDKKPGGWEKLILGIGGDNRRLPFAESWLSYLVLGMTSLDSPGEGYDLLLLGARKRLLVCFALFMIFVIGLGTLKAR